jgi:DNA primase
MQEKIIKEFFERFQKEVSIPNLMVKMDKMPQTGNGIQQFYNCPFHSDSTPSFSVNIERNVFRCFGCEREGGPYKLIKEYLLFENQSATPQSVVAFAEVDFQFPNFRVFTAAETGKRDKFKSMLAPAHTEKTGRDKAAVITQIMMGLSNTAADVNLWEELFT